MAGAYVTSEDSAELLYDDHATVLNARLELSYLNLAQGLDLKVPIFLRRGLDGNTQSDDAGRFVIEHIAPG